VRFDFFVFFFFLLPHPLPTPSFLSLPVLFFSFLFLSYLFFFFSFLFFFFFFFFVFLLLRPVSPPPPPPFPMSKCDGRQSLICTLIYTVILSFCLPPQNSHLPLTTKQSPTVSRPIGVLLATMKWRTELERSSTRQNQASPSMDSQTPPPLIDSVLDCCQTSTAITL